MWSAMRQQGVDVPQLSEQDAADLFAFFYSARYFDRPGDAGRGKRAFAARHCADCHGINDSKVAAAPPVSRWQSLQSPIALAEAMWNHAGRMREEMARQNISWQKLSPTGADGHSRLFTESEGDARPGRLGFRRSGRRRGRLCLRTKDARTAIRASWTYGSVCAEEHLPISLSRCGTMRRR